MINRTIVSTILFASFTLLPAAPALAQGEIIITQAKANAGGVTPGDGAGFPVTLSLPGAYVLGSNLTVPANKSGLLVTSHNVDIDMNGFRLNGAGKVATFGVVATHGESRIHDGVITSFKFDGIFLSGVGTNSWVVENMQIVNNGRDGINAPSSFYSRFLNNSVLANVGDGIRCREYCHVEGSNVSDNGGFGIVLNSGTVIGNTIFSNTLQGIFDGAVPDDDVGFGNNTLADNNNVFAQVSGGLPMHPNACLPAPC